MAGFDEQNLHGLHEIGKIFHEIGAHEDATPELTMLAVKGIEEAEAILARYMKEIRRFKEMTKNPFATEKKDNG